MGPKGLFRDLVRKFLKKFQVCDPQPPNECRKGKRTDGPSHSATSSRIFDCDAPWFSDEDRGAPGVLHEAPRIHWSHRLLGGAAGWRRGAAAIADDWISQEQFRQRFGGTCRCIPTGV
jgi:hypothetical protein